jgi:hypothetical protein
MSLLLLGAGPSSQGSAIPEDALMDSDNEVLLDSDNEILTEPTP